MQRAQAGAILAGIPVEPIMFKTLVRLAMTYAIGRMLSRGGRRGGLVDAVLRARKPRRW